MSVHAFFIRHPEYWAWVFSLLVWIWLIKDHLSSSSESRVPDGVIYCMPAGGNLGYSRTDGFLTFSQTDGFRTDDFRIDAFRTDGFRIDGSPMIPAAIPRGLVNWIFMVIGMMFPLLNEPVRHVAFSVRRRDRGSGILCFLMGYVLIWAAVGALFGLLPFLQTWAFLQTLPFLQTSNRLINVSLFIFAAASMWLPGRSIRMTKCGQTMPIRIQGWQLYTDCIHYGLKIGVVCLKLCWAPMAALVIAHHNLILMYLVTVVLLLERYLVPHTSKFSAYALGMIALALFGISG